MKTPKLEEVKEYFKDAKIVIPIDDNVEVDITKNIKREIHQWGGCFWIDIDEKVYSGTSVLLLDPTQGYAKILSYKEPKEKTYKITREQIKQLYHNSSLEYNQLVVADLKNWFPEVFETKLPNCFTGWVLDEKYPKVIAYSENGFLKYGFDANGNWIEGTNTKLLNEREATEQEVEEALIKEAVKRGFKEGVYFNGVDDYAYNNSRRFNCIFESFDDFNDFELQALTPEETWDTNQSNPFIFKDGVWAEIIPTLTIQEAEAKLNCKIV